VKRQRNEIKLGGSMWARIKKPGQTNRGATSKLLWDAELICKYFDEAMLVLALKCLLLRGMKSH
jgi:hypothetical protein